jgi:methyl-accepting chemotaxis protein
MFNNLTVKQLLQWTLLILAAVAVFPLASRAWQSWSDLRTDQRILQAAGASEDAFRALTAIRSDRTSTQRSWSDHEPITADNTDYIRKIQDREMTALRSLAARLDDIAFNDKARIMPDLRQTLDHLTRMQDEFWRGVSQPLANRRAGLGDEYFKQGIALQTSLQDISSTLFITIRYQDPMVDDMMRVKQLAWRARNDAGDASLAFSRALLAGHMSTDDARKYDTAFGVSVGAWHDVEEVLAGMDPPAALRQAVAKVQQEYFGADYSAMREKMLAALLTGGKTEMDVNAWARYVVPRLDVMQEVATAALGAAQDHASALHQTAVATLLINTVLLLLVASGAGGAIVLVNRRVVQPLHVLRDAMSQLAAGSLTEAISFPDRNDEIGALADALHVFQDQALVKSRLEQAEHENREREARRQRQVEAEIQKFEDSARDAFGSLTNGATKMRGAAEDMEAVSSRSSLGMRTVAEAARETSGSITSIAAATEELSSSIGEISRHVSHATSITGRAVDETRRTDETVRGLAESASRIGAVVKLINDIAGRTNLLALNATIEAARAGEAGKGFAVVASEVKSLATQTARATEDIARQITEVQGVTDETVQAIRRIATTIHEVNSVATSIAAGVEEQGASTQEIARNVRQAAARTREMTETIENVSRDAQVTDTAARDVKATSASVAGETDQLHRRVDAFLEGIRAA